jgi:hypothetical protein
MNPPAKALSRAETPRRLLNLKLITVGITAKCLVCDRQKRHRPPRRPGPQRQSPKASNGLSVLAAALTLGAARPSRAGTLPRPPAPEVTTPGIPERHPK